MNSSCRKLVLLIAVLSSACSDEDETGPDKIAVEGSYTLQSINGRALPVTLLDFFGGAYVLQQRGGTMTLNANKTFLERDMLRELFNDANGRPVQIDTTVVLNGVWELEQDSVILLTTQRDGSVLFGVASKSRLVLHYEPASVDSLFTYVYRKD